MQKIEKWERKLVKWGEKRRTERGVRLHKIIEITDLKTKKNLK